jgi:hypothetical protein
VTGRRTARVMLAVRARPLEPADGFEVWWYQDPLFTISQPAETQGRVWGRHPDCGGVWRRVVDVRVRRGLL